MAATGMRQPTGGRRERIFAALRELLIEHPWREINIESVAKRAGYSRQTIYNDFGSRFGLAEAYTVALADVMCDVIVDVIAGHPDEPTAALEAGLRIFLESAGDDPLIQRVQAGEAHADLLRLVTADSAGLLIHVTDRLVEGIGSAWPGLDRGVLVALARTVARLALSYVTMPPETDADLAAEIASLLGPAISAALDRTSGR